MPTTLHRGSWRAMGCSVVVEIATAGGRALAGQLLSDARRTIARLEQRWSRFREDSDICRLNRAGGVPTEVDPATITLLEAMVAGVAATAGAFDPTLLAPLVGLGYQTSWEAGRTVDVVPPTAPVRRGTVEGIAVHRRGSVVQLPPDTTLDAGGIGKGLAADLAADRLVRHGASTALVSIGGDLKIAGQPLPAGWPVNIVHPTHDEPIAQVAIGSGGVATSGTTLRRWTTTDGSEHHHLLDPLTTRPVAGGRRAVIQATAVAGTAAWAEVFATMLVVRGEPALADLERHGIGGLVVRGDDEVLTNDAWATFAAGHHPARSGA